jgi:putative transposase
VACALVVIDGARHSTAQVCKTLGVSRSNVHERRSRASREDRRGRPPVDEPQVLTELRDLAAQRPTYGYRRLWVLLGRSRQRRGLPPVNVKRIYRLAKANKLLLQRYTGGPPVRVHEGTVAVGRSNQRYCSDGFEIRCDNGERVRVIFSLDCCDRQAIAFAATTAGISGELVRDVIVQTMSNRFGEVAELPHPAEWLSDNGSGYIAAETRSFATDIGFIPCRTPYRSPQSNGMAEAFVKTFKRDYVRVNPTPDAHTVLEQLPSWFSDYNEVHPHSALRYRSPNEFRSVQIRHTTCPESEG